MKFSMGDLGFFTNEYNVTMNGNKFPNSPIRRFEIHQINTTKKIRDSPTSSILKTPTAIFVTTRSSSSKTKRLKFANGPVDLQTLRNGSYDSNVSLESSVEASEDRKFNNNGEIVFEDNIVEVALSPVKTMQVSTDSWKAFLAYKKYNDYPNETEKTDYTYSRLSKYRHKEIIPGFLVMPNLSRSSLSSRRSSLSLSSNGSFNESYQSGLYEFNVASPKSLELSYDLKSPNQSNKATRSKYYLRSSTFNGEDAREFDSKQAYFGNEYYINSAPEKIIKKTAYVTTEAPEKHVKSFSFSTSEMPEQLTQSYSFSTSETPGKINKPYSYSTSQMPDLSSHYYGKVRSMNLDDADIDEVDDNSVQYDKGYFSSSEAYSDDIWSQKKEKSVKDNFSNLFTKIFLCVSSIGIVAKDLFSQYILRRQNNWSQPSTSRNWRSDNLGYSTAGGSWIPWGTEKAYPSSSYYYDRHYRGPNTWYQRLFHALTERFSNITNLIRGNTAGYDYSRYSQTSRKRKYWWLLIPLLILGGLWLFKAEEENGFISNQYKALDCRTNGFLTSVENSIKPKWHLLYMTYKKAVASASCYVNDSWERLKLPFNHVYEMCSNISFSPGSFLNFVRTFWFTLCQGLRNFFVLPLDAFSNAFLFLFNFFTDFFSAVGNVLRYACSYFRDAFLSVCNSFGGIIENAWSLLRYSLQNIKSYLYLLLFAPPKTVKFDYKVPESSKEVCLKQQQNIEKIEKDLNDFKIFSRDLSLIKKKIDDLELEFQREKESRKNQNDFYNRQLSENHKTLQKYQAAVNHALLSSKRPGHFSNSSIQYFLDNQSDSLKQWIAQNFLLKSDSANIDENKIGLLIAKYSNRTGSELLDLKQEFKNFVENHKDELKSLRSSMMNFNVDNNLSGSDFSETYIRKLIADALKLYDADKTGRVDYALESAGGQILSVRCTETYIERPKSFVFLGFPLYTETRSPRDAISPDMNVGQCWAFVGSHGYLVIQLSHTIMVTGFTMEHIPKSLVPRGHFQSAPNNFSMWGLKSEHDLQPHLFGHYTYLDNEEPRQYFPVKYHSPEPYSVVELKITSNHGNPNFTCLYRIRVHGDLHSVQL